MELIFNYAWFWLAALLVLQAQSLRMFSSRLVSTGHLTHSELNRFLNYFSLICLIFSLIMGSLQIAGGFDTPFAVYCRPHTNIWLIFSWIFVAACWIALLWWIWFGNGTQIMFAFASLSFLYQPKRPIAIRNLVSALIVLGGPLLFWASTIDFFEICDRTIGSLELSG